MSNQPLCVGRSSPVYTISVTVISPEPFVLNSITAQFVGPMPPPVIDRREGCRELPELTVILCTMFTVGIDVAGNAGVGNR